MTIEVHILYTILSKKLFRPFLSSQFENNKLNFAYLERRNMSSKNSPLFYKFKKHKRNAGLVFENDGTGSWWFLELDEKKINKMRRELPRWGVMSKWDRGRETKIYLVKWISTSCKNTDRMWLFKRERSRKKKKNKL